MNIKPIRSEKDYLHALKQADELMGAPAGTKECQFLEVLATLIESYESKHFPIEKPDAVTAVLFRLEQQGLTQSDLAKILGSKSRASEFLNNKRELSKEHMKTIHEKLGIPYDILFNQDIQTKKASAAS